MATLDIIKLHGGNPANFLDVGGGATSAQVQKAFELLNADENVKRSLVKSSRGIRRCELARAGDILAETKIGNRSLSGSRWTWRGAPAQQRALLHRCDSVAARGTRALRQTPQ